MSTLPTDAVQGRQVPENQFDGEGDAAAFAATYDALRLAARRLMRRTAPDDPSLEPTGLVHEAVLRLCRSPGVGRHPDPAYRFAAALRAMRRILIERARARRRVKRGGGLGRVPLDRVLDHLEARRVDVEGLDETLDRLAAWAPRRAEVVGMRFLLGMTVPEIAARLGLGASTVHEELALARAWLKRELTDAG